MGKSSSRFSSLYHDAPVGLQTALQHPWDFRALQGPCQDLLPCSFQWVLCTRVELCPPVPILTVGSIFTDVPFADPLRGRTPSVGGLPVLPNPADFLLCLLTAQGFQVLFLAQFFYTFT